MRKFITSLLILIGFGVTTTYADTVVSGLMQLPCGSYPGFMLLEDGAVLRGSGICTVIGGVAGVRNSTTRQYRFRVEDLMIDGALANGYIGIDFRNVSHSVVKNVWIIHVLTGVFVYNLALYNAFENVTISLSPDPEFAGGIDGYEIIRGPDSGANQTTIIGGAVGGPAPIGVYQRGSDFLTIIGTAFEGVKTCFDQQNFGFSMLGVRCDTRK
ncbi:MAG TPA: hypothetical protein VKF40_24995 [Burkholderiales bacterium]|nr:hypothetical protein [Burkholderiales bacterium]